MIPLFALSSMSPRWVSRLGLALSILLLGYSVGVIAASESAPALMIGVIFAVVIYLVSLYMRIPPQWGLLAFGVPFMVVLLNSKFHFMPFFPDAAHYDELGWSVAQAWKSGVAPALNGTFRERIYAYLVGSLYFVLGRTPPAMATVNAGLWGLSTVYWLSIARSVLRLRISILPGLLFSVYPAALLYMSANLREGIVAFLTVFAAFHFTNWLRGHSGKALAWSLAGLVLAAVFRPEVLPIFLGAAFIGVLCTGGLAKLKRAALFAIAVLLFLWLITLAGVSLPSYVNPFQLHLIESLRAAGAARPDGYLPNMKYSTWIEAVRSLPIRLAYLLLSPFPWETSAYGRLAITLDAVFILAVLPAALAGLVRLLRRMTPEGLFLVSFMVFSLAGYSLVVSSSGVASRRRLLAVCVLVLLAALGAARRRASHGRQG